MQRSSNICEWAYRRTGIYASGQYRNRRMFTLSVIDGRGVLSSSASVRAATPGRTEQIAVALASSDP